MASLYKAIIEGDLEAVKQLLKTGESLNSVNPEDGRTPLTTACKCGHLEIIRALLDAGAQVNRKDKFKDGYGKDYSQAPLAAACDRDTQDHASVDAITRFLIDRGADVLSAHPPDRDGPLHFAAKHGHVEVVAHLLEMGVDVNMKGSWGNTALTWAADKGTSLDLVKMLLDRGARINPTDKEGSNAFFKLLSGGKEKDNVDIARLLIDKGANLEEKGYGGALYWAAFCGKRKIAELLIARGLDVNSRDYKGEETAVMGAMKQKHYDVVKVLLEHGADPDVKDMWDGSLLRQAVAAGKKNLVKIILEILTEKKALPKNMGKIASKKSAESRPNSKNTGALVEAAEKGDLAIVKMLHEAGVDINENTGGREGSPLMKAAAFGKVEVIKYLLDNGADITARDAKGSTALLYAASEGEDEAVRILLERGALINEKNDLNWNALMQACFKGHYSTAKLLLERGSPTDEIDDEKGATTLWLAKQSGNAKLVELLQNAGAKERHVRQRKSGEPYFSIAECDVCAYLPPRAQLTYDYSPEEIPGLEIVFTERSGEYKADETEMIKKCLHCGTYYHHHHYIDTEDSIGGAGPVCSHHILRYNLLWLHGLLRKLNKVDELAEAQARYQPIIDDLLRLVEAGQHFKPYIQPYVVETLVDYFVTRNDWDLMKNLLLEHKDKGIRLETMQDLLAVWSDKAQEDLYPPFYRVRNFTSDVQSKLKSMLHEHESEFVDIVKQSKIEDTLEIAKEFTKKMGTKRLASKPSRSPKE
nr:ankyrin repeat domain-containing protein [Candidatus Sigynarchaeota archaeon]